jgi:hypothetical protein
VLQPIDHCFQDRFSFAGKAVVPASVTTLRNFLAGIAARHGDQLNLGYCFLVSAVRHLIHAAGRAAEALRRARQRRTTIFVGADGLSVHTGIETKRITGRIGHDYVLPGYRRNRHPRPDLPHAIRLISAFYLPGYCKARSRAPYRKMCSAIRVKSEYTAGRYILPGSCQKFPLSILL